MVPTVHVISHEQVVRVGAIAADAEQLHKVLELAMDVAAHLQPVISMSMARVAWQGHARGGPAGLTTPRSQPIPAPVPTTAVSSRTHCTPGANQNITHAPLSQPLQPQRTVTGHCTG